MELKSPVMIHHNVFFHGDRLHGPLCHFPWRLGKGGMVIAALICGLGAGIKPCYGQESVQDFSYWAGLCESQGEAVLTAGNATDDARQKALTACETAITLNPNDAIIWAQRGELLFALQRYPDAVAAYDYLLTLTPLDSQALAQRCQSLIYLQRYDTAIASCESALQTDQGWGRVTPALTWTYRGLAYAQMAHREGALSAYVWSTKLRPTVAQTWTSACGHFLQATTNPIAFEQCQTTVKRNLDEALTSYTWATRLQPDFSFAWTEQCILHYQTQQTQAGIMACQQAIQENANWGTKNAGFAWAYLGRLQTRTRQYLSANTSYQQASEHFNVALANHTTDAESWTEYGAVLMVLGQYAQALTAQEWALKPRPTYAIALARQCETYNRLGQTSATVDQGKEQYQNALMACDQAIQTGDGDWGTESLAFAWYQRGNAAIGQGQYEEALNSLARALALQPKNALVYSSRAVALWYLNNQDPNALAATDAAIQIHPDCSDAHFNQGRIQASRQQYAEAIAAYDQALQGDAQVGDPATLIRTYVNQSSAFWHLQNFPAAITAAEQAIAFQPPKAIAALAWYNKGLAYASLGQYVIALDAYAQAIKLAPDNTTFQKARAIAEQQLPKPEPETASSTE